MWLRVGTLGCAIIQLCFFACADSFAGDPIDSASLDDALTCVDGEEREIQVCGRNEKIKRICVFPFVTGPMADEARKHDELKEEFHRVNSCVSTDPVCAANPDKLGGQEVPDEVQADMGPDMPSKIRFHISVTDVELKKARDDMALVSRKGFTRDMVIHYFLYRVTDDRKFNEDAEGVNLVAKGALDREREELLKLADVLKEMKDLFEQRKDKVSEENTAAYETIARNRALEVEAVSCELGRLAYKNRRIENRHKQITLDAAKETYGLGSPESPSPNPVSDITGVNPDPTLGDPGVSVKVGAPAQGIKPDAAPSAADPGGTPMASGVPTSTTGASAPPPSMTGASSPGRAPASDPDNVLASFGPDPDEISRQFREVVSAPAGTTEENDGLFDRVKRQYRGRYQLGEFRPTVVD